MRKSLRSLYTKRGFIQFEATYHQTNSFRFDETRQYTLFKWVWKGDEYISDHVWVVHTQAIDRMNLVRGVHVKFLARIRKYSFEGKENYTLIDVRHIQIISQRTRKRWRW